MPEAARPLPEPPPRLAMAAPARNEGSATWLAQEIRRLARLASSLGHGGAALQAAIEGVHEDLGAYLDCGPDALELFIEEVDGASSLRDETHIQRRIERQKWGRINGR